MMTSSGLGNPWNVTLITLGLQDFRTVLNLYTSFPIRLEVSLYPAGKLNFTDALLYHLPSRL